MNMFGSLLSARIALILLALVPFLVPPSAKATGVFERPDVGLQISNLAVVDREADTTFNFLLLGVEGGLNIPLFRPESHMAFGLNPQARLWVDLASGVTGQYTSILGATLPVLATFKYNTDAAERGTKANIGFSIGAGMQYSGVLFSPDLTAGFISPTAMAEVNFGSRSGGGGLFKIRFSSQFGPVDAEVARQDVVPLAMNLQSLHLVWTHGY